MNNQYESHKLELIIFSFDDAYFVYTTSTIESEMPDNETEA